MELAGVAVDREALTKQATVWDQEAATLKENITKLGTIVEDCVGVVTNSNDESRK